MHDSISRVLERSWPDLEEYHRCMKHICYYTYSPHSSTHLAHDFSNFFNLFKKKKNLLMFGHWNTALLLLPLNHSKSFPLFQNLFIAWKQEIARWSKILWVGWIVWAIKSQILPHIFLPALWADALSCKNTSPYIYLHCFS